MDATTASVSVSSHGGRSRVEIDVSWSPALGTKMRFLRRRSSDRQTARQLAREVMGDFIREYHLYEPPVAHVRAVLEGKLKDVETVPVKNAADQEGPSPGTSGSSAS